MTTVINLLGGPGTGKSTAAAQLFAEMKMRGMRVEHVQEYVKQWAYENKDVGPFDQLYIFGKQARKEYVLYNKVDFIVTDSPVLLSAFYEVKYTDHTMVKQALPEYMRIARKAGVHHVNFVLQRRKPYDPVGRYQTEEEAREIDGEMEQFLRENGYWFDTVGCDDRSRAGFILDLIERDRDPA